ncbi:hypothetical protein DFQ26_001216 [Actinomortierella ambigua]|nr:hypothetical protein DFQ26_001216 [Actinomortierella ambigua]
MRDQNSCKSKGSRWNLDGEQSSKSSDEEEEKDETKLSEPTSAAARSTRPHSSHWRRWTGASIRELCFRATGAVDTYLHDMLRLSQVNRSVTLLDIRFNVAIQFNLHILLVDFNNGGDDDHDSSNHNNRHHHDHDDDDDDGPMLIKRKLQTFRLSNCDISKAYLFTLLRHLDRQHLRSLALNNLYRRYRQSQPQNTWSTVPLAFFGCSAYPMNMIDFAGILQTTQWESHDQARNLVEFIAPKLYYPVEFVAPPPMDDDTDEDEDDDTEDEDEEALSMDGMGDEVLDSDNEEEANGQAVVIEPVHQDPKTVDGSLLRQRSSSTSNALKARLSRYVQRLVHYRSSTTTDCVKGSPKWTMANKTMANKSKKNHKKKKSQTRSKFWTSLFSPATNMSCSNLPPRVWACGSTLKRLELSFTSRFDGGWTRASSTRAVFGFLVTTLPNLHHLVVRQEYGVLAIDGGLCLLTRLRHLQQLEIQIRQFRHWAARYNDKLPIITSSTTSIFPPSSKQRLNHEKQEHQCGGGENAVHNKPHLLTWLQSDPQTIPTPTRRTKNIVSKDHVGHEQQQQPQRQQHTKNQQHPPGTSSLAIARRVALLDHRGGHFAKGAGRAMLWEKPPSSTSAAAAATTPFSSSSSSPSPSSQATTPQTHGCSWLQMRRITIKYEHGLSDDVHTLQDDFHAVRPDITLSCNFIPWTS